MITSSALVFYSSKRTPAGEHRTPVRNCRNSIPAGVDEIAVVERLGIRPAGGQRVVRVADEAVYRGPGGDVVGDGPRVGGVDVEPDALGGGDVGEAATRSTDVQEVVPTVATIAIGRWRAARSRPVAARIGRSSGS
jgi:hypothetical protein